MRGIFVGSWIVLSLAACRAPAGKHSFRPAGTPRVATVVGVTPAPAAAEAPAKAGAPAASSSAGSRRPPGAVPEPWDRELVSFPARSSVPEDELGERNLPARWTGAPIGPEAPGTQVAFDFGVGERRYDDGVRSLEPLPTRAVGFSDSVLQMGIRRRLAPGAYWTSGFAAIRHQDEPILSDLGETEVGWVTVGVQLQF